MPNVITHDGVAYIENAKTIVSGDFKKIKEISFFNLYPLIIIAFQKIFKDWELSARIVSIVFGTLSVIPLFFLTKRLISKDIAILLCFFYAIHPHIVAYSSDVLREPLFWCLCLYALWIGVEGIMSINKNKWFFPFLCALFTGLSISVRIEGVIIIFIMFIWGMWLYRKHDINGSILFSKALIFIFSFIIIFLPFLFFIKEKLGWWEFGLFGEKILYLFFYHEGIETLIQKDSYVIEKSPTLVKNFIEISLRHRHVVYIFEVLYKFFKSLNIVFFIIFLFGIFKRKRTFFIKGEVFFLIWFLVAFASCYFYVATAQYLGTRHGLLMGIPALLWVSIGFFELVDKIKVFLKRLKILSPYISFSSVFILFLIIVFNGHKILTSNRNDKIELKKAGIYLKEMGFKEKTIATIPPLSRILYYADAKPVIIREGVSGKELIKIFEEKKVEYILIDKKMFENFFNKENHFLDVHNLKKIDMPMFNTFKDYSLDIYKIVYNGKG